MLPSEALTERPTRNPQVYRFQCVCVRVCATHVSEKISSEILLIWVSCYFACCTVRGRSDQKG